MDLAPSNTLSDLLQDVLGRPEAGSGKLTADDLNLMLRQMAEGSENLPPLPTSAFGRESFYEGRL